MASGERELKIAVASIPRCGSTLLARATAGLPPGNTWPRDLPEVKKMHWPRENELKHIDRAVFLFGDIIDAVISTRFKRWDENHFQNCDCDKALAKVDIFKRDDLNYEPMFDYWTAGHRFPVIAVRYEAMWRNADLISGFVGKKLNLPPKRKRSTNLNMVTREEFIDICRTYSSLIRRVERMPDIKVIANG